MMMSQYLKFIQIITLGLFSISIAHSQNTDSIGLVGKLEITGLPIHDVYGYTDTATGNQYALLCASDAGLIIIDVSTPSNPLQVGSIFGGGVEPVDIKTWRNYAYGVAEVPGVTGKVIDLSDPGNPTLVGSFPGGHNISITDNGYLYLASPGIRIFNLNIDPISPVLVYTDNSCNGHDISIIGQRLYDFSGNCGTRIYDISQPDTLVLLGTVPSSGIFHHSGWPSEDANYLFVCDELASPSENDITVWDISDLSAPFMVDSFADSDSYVHNIYVKDDYAFVSYYRAGFRVFDVSEPANISLVAEYDTDSTSSGPGFGGNFGLYTFWGNDKILASDEENGLYIFSFTEKSPPVNGISYYDNDDLLVYPNPSSYDITVTLPPSGSQGQQVMITDVTGRVLFSENVSANSTQLKRVYSLSRFAEGVYFVTVKTNQSTETQKIVLVR